METNTLPSVLIADDDIEICKLVHLSIQSIVGDVWITHNGRDTLMHVQKLHPNFIVLDLNLPDLDGFSICSWVRKNEQISQPFIIILTARGSDKDKMYGYDIGADEYINKPFSPNFLSRRIEMLWKKYAQPTKAVSVPRPEKPLTYHEISIDPLQKRVFCEGKEIQLTRMEWDILLLLIHNPGQVFTRKEILEKVRGTHYYVNERAIDVHLFSLRKKLQNQGNHIKTKRGMGYYLAAVTDGTK